MNDNDIDNSNVKNDSMNELFAFAAPRPKPRVEAEEHAFDVLQSQWQDQTNRRNVHGRMVTWGLAASFVLAVGIVFTWLSVGQQTDLDPVADIVRTEGNLIYVNNTVIDGVPGETSPFSVGDVLTTGSDSRISLQWNSGGSVRLDQNSEVVLTSADAVELISGSVYFDSLPLERTGNQVPKFAVETVAGHISHVGTQFATRISESTVIISVREGQVLIDGPKFNYLGQPRDMLRIDADGLVSKDVIEPFDVSWSWAEAIAPNFNPTGKTAQDMVIWISRETGRPIEYKSEAAKANAASTDLTGFDQLSPSSALKAMPIATDLRYEIVDQSILIRLD